MFGCEFAGVLRVVVVFLVLGFVRVGLADSGFGCEMVVSDGFVWCVCWRLGDLVV